MMFDLSNVVVMDSCEDRETVYVDFPDGLRLIFRESKYAGWYLPGEAE